ncbi:MAG: glycoside hydrolase family 65 protein [Bacillota bacterium]
MREFHAKKLGREPKFKTHPWKIIEEEFKVEKNHHHESIFSVGNGYMGVRGTLEEDYSGPRETTCPGFYINGFFDNEDIIYGEDAPNLPRKSQTIVNLADWTEINLYIGDEKLDLLTGETREYQRELDMRKGILKRTFIWRSPSGKEMEVKIIRFLSLTRKNIGIIDYTFRPLNFKGEVRLVSALNGDVHNPHHFRQKQVLKTIKAGFTNNRYYLNQKTSQSELEVATAVKNVFATESKADFRLDKYRIDNKLHEERIIKTKKENWYRLTKYVALKTSKKIKPDRLIGQVLTDVNVAAEDGYDVLLSEQKKFLEEYWEDFDLKLYGAKSLQQALRFNAFQLLQSTGQDGETSVAAKGLSGEFYEGHYFWDTEAYIVPFYIFNRPEMARKLLEFRYNTLDKARDNARRVRLDGALYPWRTINGEEASGFFMGSTVQFHIDADIAYAIYLYYTVTEDKEFLYSAGAEILAETARMWYSRGSFINSNGGHFCFNEVCGPDEYKPGVNNNCYTNFMAQFNLRYACKILKQLAEESEEKYNNLKERIGLREEELSNWDMAADKVYLPFNEDMGIHPQDDSFVNKDPINIDQEISDEELPLVQHWHPLTIWRYQLIKQADVILLMLMLGDNFSLEEKKANYDYYEPKTTHDSSLSPSVYSIIASEIGYTEEAFNYFVQTARLDLDDFNENAWQGLHTAGMGSAWMVLVFGFAGMRSYHGEIQFDPYLPEQIEGYQFTIAFKGRHLRVRVDSESTSYRLLSGPALYIHHCGKRIELDPGEEVEGQNRNLNKLPWREEE